MPRVEPVISTRLPATDSLSTARAAETSLAIDFARVAHLHLCELR
jgi:hypothetical protein